MEKTSIKRGVHTPEAMQPKLRSSNPLRPAEKSPLTFPINAVKPNYSPTNRKNSTTNRNHRPFPSVKRSLPRFRS